MGFFEEIQVWIHSNTIFLLTYWIDHSIACRLMTLWNQRNQDYTLTLLRAFVWKTKMLPSPKPVPAALCNGQHPTQKQFSLGLPPTWGHPYHVADLHAEPTEALASYELGQPMFSSNSIERRSSSRAPIALISSEADAIVSRSHAGKRDLRLRSCIFSVSNRPHVQTLDVIKTIERWMICYMRKEEWETFRIWRSSAMAV
jgi:hypothetical protein